jgi:hypothetical protein
MNGKPEPGQLVRIWIPLSTSVFDQGGDENLLLMCLLLVQFHALNIELLCTTVKGTCTTALPSESLHRDNHNHLAA